MNRPFFAIAALASATALALSGPAAAHAKLVSSNPAKDVVLAAAPKAITLTFNEELVPSFSKFTLSMPGHGMTVPVKTSVSKDGKTLTGIPRSALGKGAYKIVWSAASADGHKLKGELAFKVA